MKGGVGEPVDWHTGKGGGGGGWWTGQGFESKQSTVEWVREWKQETAAQGTEAKALHH